MMLDWIRERCIEDGDCWIWTAGCTSRGVPSMHKNGKVVGVRRVIAEYLGMVIEGKKVTTKCGNKRCVCPDHVLPATPVALGKMVAKRTGYASFTVRNKKISDAKRANSSKLTAEQAKEIRESEDRLIDIAAKYGIAAATAQRIKAGKVWKTYGATPFSGLGAR